MYICVQNSEFQLCPLKFQEVVMLYNWLEIELISFNSYLMIESFSDMLKFLGHIFALKIC